MSPFSGQWVPDSGASYHMTLDLSMLQQSDSGFGLDKVNVGEGKAFSLSHMGEYESCYSKPILPRSDSSSGGASPYSKLVIYFVRY
jgi:hypothetical protein